MACLVTALPGGAQEPASAPVQLSRAEKAKLPRLAILEFKVAPESWRGWRAGGWGAQMGTLSGQLRDLFTTELLAHGAGKLRLIDRERLEDIRKELELQQSGEVDVATVQKLGKLLGVSYVMTGKVTRFAYRSSVAGVELVGAGVEIAYDGELVNKVFEPVVQRLAPRLLAAIVRNQAGAAE